MTYDLRRLSLHGFTRRLPLTHRHRVAALGAQLAMFYARLHTRALRPVAWLQPAGAPAGNAPSAVSMPRSRAISRRCTLLA